MEPPGQQQMTWLPAEERHRAFGFDGNALNLACCAIDAAWHIDGQHPPAIETFRDLGGDAFEWSR